MFFYFSIAYRGGDGSPASRRNSDESFFKEMKASALEHLQAELGAENTDESILEESLGDDIVVKVDDTILFILEKEDSSTKATDDRTEAASEGKILNSTLLAEKEEDVIENFKEGDEPIMGKCTQEIVKEKILDGTLVAEKEEDVIEDTKEGDDFGISEFTEVGVEEMILDGTSDSTFIAKVEDAIEVHKEDDDSTKVVIPTVVIGSGTLAIKNGIAVNVTLDDGITGSPTDASFAISIEAVNISFDNLSMGLYAEETLVEQPYRIFGIDIVWTMKVFLNFAFVAAFTVVFSFLGL